MSTAATATPPGPSSPPIIGFLPAFRRQPAQFLEKMGREYGELVHFRLGPQRVYLLNHPDHIKDMLVTYSYRFNKSRILQRARTLLGQGLLTSEGQVHLRQRRLSQPAFHRDRLIGYAHTMSQYAGSLRSRLRAGDQMDMDAEMMRLTLAIVAKTLFNADAEEDAHVIGESINDIMQSFGIMLLPYSEHLEKIPFLPFTRRLIRARQILDSIIYRFIRDRRASGRDEGDLLSMLLLARDEDGSAMSDVQVRDEALTLFLAGHETTATALTWTWYLLSQHPAVEARVHEEVDRVLGDRLPVFEDFSRLPFTEMVFAESMRLYPPAWSVARRCVEPHQIAGYDIAPGSILIASQWVMHRNPAYWPDPEKFDPERFRPELRETRRKFSYFPFGGGPRVCIGERFAWLEGVLLIATLARRWRFRLARGQRVEPRPVLTLRTRYGMRMIAEER